MTASAFEQERNEATVVEFKSYSGSFLKEIRKITSQDNRSLGRDLETGPPVAAPRTRPWHSVRGLTVSCREAFLLCLPTTYWEALGHTSTSEMLWSFLSMVYLQDTVKRSVTGLPLICSKSSWHWFTYGISWSVLSQVYLWNVVKHSVNGLPVRYRETFGQTSTSEVS